MTKKKNTVYVPMSADMFHASHVKVLEEASKYGKIIVGLNSLGSCLLAKNMH